MDSNPNDYLDIEQAVLGAILLDPQLIDTAMEILQPEDFGRTKNRIIFESMLDIADGENPIDLMILGDRLQRRKQLEAVGVQYLSELPRSTPSASNIRYYAELVKRAALDRDTRRALQQLVEDEEADAADIIATMQEKSAELAERTSKKNGFRSLKEVTMEAFDTLETKYTNKSDGGTTGIPSGYPDLDRMTAGFQRQDLIIVAARPSVGKTAFALNIAQSAGINTKETIAVFSLEMGAVQLAMRMISAEGNVDASRMRSGNIEPGDWDKIAVAIGKLADANIFIDDTPVVTVNDIRAQCRKLKKERGLGMILIDYLQLIAGSGRKQNRQQEVSEISRTLKQIARELNVPVIALSQLSRGVEQRQDKRPMMSDLRESGSIEQDADVVAFLYRDDYYDKESEKKNVIEIIIAKQRNGPTGTVELAFLKNYNKFVNLDRSHQEQPKEQPPRKPPAGNPRRRPWGA